MPVDVFQSLWHEFAVESGEHLECIEPLLVGAEGGTPAGSTAEMVATLFRGMHSVKGMAAALALHGMERVAHHAEHLLGQVRDGRCVLDPPLVGVLLEALDELKRLRALTVADRVDMPASETVMRRLEAARGALEGLPDRGFELEFGAAVQAALHGGGTEAAPVPASASASASAPVPAQPPAEGPPPLHPDRPGLERLVAALRPALPQLAQLAGPELENPAVRAAVRGALEVVRSGADALAFTQMARTSAVLAALIPFEGRLGYEARERAIDALAVLRREVATLEAATGSDGGGQALDDALNAALALDFTARRRALLDLLARFDLDPAGFSRGGAAVTRAAELAGDIYDHFSFLYNTNAGRLLLMIENLLDHAAKGDLLPTPELVGLVRRTLADLAPAPGQPLRDLEAAATAETITAFETAIRAASSAAATAATDHAAAAATAAAKPPPEAVPPAPPWSEAVDEKGRQLAGLVVTPELLERLSEAQRREVDEQVGSGRGRLWEIVASLEEAEDKAERFAGWLETRARPLTSCAVAGSTALAFRFLVLTAEDDGAVLAALAEIDPEGRVLSGHRCGGDDGPQPGSFGSSGRERSEPLVPAPAEAPSQAVGSLLQAVAGTGNVLRVPGEVVDHFLSVIGEMVMAAGQLDDAVWGDDRRGQLALALDLKRLVREMRAQGGADPAHLEALQRHAAAEDARSRALRLARDRLAVTLGRLQEAALELRVVPVETVFTRLPRLARDLATSHGKQVRVEIDGRGVRIDKGMVDQLLDPLIHMVRNAIDHGIEPPDERRAAGKPPVATLIVRADQRENRVVIEISDDGRGLDAEAIRVRAVERQLVGLATSRLMREADLFRLVLLPGFSTAAAVTETSGRGVGMDVVQTSVTRLGGAIEIRSQPGRGTTFTLRLPLSAAIQDVLLVEACGRLHALPVRHLLELSTAGADDIQMVHGQPVMLLHGTLLPLFRLTALLDPDAGGLPRPGLPIVVLGDARQRLGVQVDRVVRRQELFVRDIHPRIAAIPGIGGAAVLGDGRVVLIVDGGDLFQLARAPLSLVPGGAPESPS